MMIVYNAVLEYVSFSEDVRVSPLCGIAFTNKKGNRCCCNELQDIKKARPEWSSTVTMKDDFHIPGTYTDRGRQSSSYVSAA